MDPLRQPQAQKMICETRPTSQINGKAEYLWREGNASIHLTLKDAVLNIILNWRGNSLKYRKLDEIYSCYNRKKL